MRFIRQFFYTVARLLGDLTAISKGPTKTGKRIVRKGLWRKAGKELKKLI